FRQSCNSILRCPSISDGRLSYQFSSDGYIRRSVYAYGSPVGIYARFVDHFGNPLSGTVEFSAGSEDSPDSQRVKMEPATVTLHWTGNAASEFSTYESGYHWIKAKITNSKNTYEKTIRTYVVKLPEKDS
ncbi:hypothetical protein QS470_25225, partial [Escherichia coli]|nr:hypothetical protein [Escherichia coli]MDL7075186.1 hypothetical protein [Escherichia coli]